MATIFNTTIPVSQLSSPLILLPPNVVRKILLATYIHLGTVSVLLWDIINNLRSDWELVSSFRAGLATWVYFTTRTSILAFSLGRAVILTHPVENCAKFQNALNSFLIIFMASTTFLFYIRVTTLYAMDRTIVHLFGLCWLCTIAVTATFAITFTAEPIAPTDYCLLNDLLLYAAITHKGYQAFIEDAITKGTLNPLLRGTPLSTIAKYLLSESHVYCCNAVVATKVFLVCAAFAFEHPTAPFQPQRAGDAAPPMITQGEFELRLSGARGGHGEASVSPMVFGERTFTADVDSAYSIHEEKRTSIYSVEGDFKS
ncbi:hypothetical protein BJ912DRAFT_974128 [Pholiota molesta]|nr:hypothetical protein BJ912DRAFT_974128 [Pholiota molesta]